jgi:serine/threonine protein kinase
MNRLPKDFFCSSKEPLYQSTNSCMYLGSYHNKKAILKLFPQEFPSEATQLSYQRDHNIGSLLYEKYPEQFCQPLKIVQEPNLLYEIKTYEGVSLDIHTKQEKMSLENFLDAAIKICQGIQCLHQQNIIHCDLKPHNILKNENGKFTIIDFESSYLVSLKNPKISKVQKGVNLFNFMKEHICI